MISVFPSTAYTTKDLAGIGYPILDLWCKEAVLYASLNGEQYIKLVIPHKAREINISQLPKDLDIIKINDMDGNEDYYRVRRPVITLKTTTIYAEHITYDLNDNFIEDIYIVDRDGQGAMDKISQGTQYAHPFILRSDITKVSNIRLVRVNPIQAMLGSADNTFLKRYGGELKRQGFTLSINNRVGVDRTDTIRSGKNLTGFESDYDFDDVTTRIMPKGPNGVLLPEKYVDSPLINNYPFPFIKDIEYSVEYEGEFENLSSAEKNRVYSELRALAKADFDAGIDVPKANYKVNFVNLRNTIEYADYRALENIGLGDMQPVYEAQYDIDIQGRVTRIEWDIINERYKTIELGNFKKGIIKSSIANQSNALVKAGNSLDVALEALKSADGKTTNYYGNLEPGNPKEGDLWYKKNGEEDELWQYQLIDGKLQWVYVTGDRYAKYLKESIDREFEEVNAELDRQEQERIQAVSDLLVKAGVNQSLAEEAKTIGNQAKVDAATALARALQAKTDAIAEATRLDTVERQSTDAKLATAKSQAVSEANSLVEAAKALLSGQISNVSTDLTQTNEAIKLLATKQSVDALTGRISSAESSLQVQADQIAQRVKSSDFDQATQRISTAETSIVQLGNRITTEISETVAKIPIELGIRNIIKGTKDLSGNSNKSLNTSETYLGFNVAKSKPSTGYADTFRSATTINLTSTSYVATFYAKSDVEGFLIDCHLSSPNTTTSAESSTGHKTKAVDGLVNVRLSTEWKRYWVKWTQTPTNNTKTIIVGRNHFVRGNAMVEIAGLALYEGDMPKDWTPAFEDYVTEIENVKTTIIQTAAGQEQLSTKLTETSSRVVAAETNIRQLINDVSTKVSQTEFDNIKNTVQANSTAITQNQNAINLKADKTVTDSLTQSINQTKADLKVTSDAVATKVSQTDFNAATNRLSTAETTIVAQAGQIEQRLTSTQVESLIASKDYATTTSVQNIVKETSDSFNRTISETKTLIPADSVNRNLLIVNGSAVGTILLGSETYPNPSVSAAHRNNRTVKEAIPVVSSEKYTFSKISTATDNFWRVSYLDANYQYIGRFARQENNFTITMPASAKFIWVSFPEAGKCKIEKGDKATAYTLATDDTTTVTAFNDVKDTVSSHTRTIAEHDTSISQVVQTANGLVSRVSSLSSIANLVYDPTNYSRYIGRNSYIPETTGTSEYKMLRINQSDLTAVANRGFQLPLLTTNFKSGEQLSYRINLWVDTVPDDSLVLEIKNGSTVIASRSIRPSETGSAQIFTGTMNVLATTTTTDEYALHVFLRKNGKVAIGQISIVRGSEPPSEFIDSTSSAQIAMNTIVSQLAGSWSVQNLTSSGAVLNQVNLNRDGSVRIDGSLVQITGKTYIENGVIKDAMIANLDAGKITAGTFDASKANVINLNANNVVSGTMSALRISGGLLKSLNNETTFNLDDGWLNFNQDSIGIKNQFSGRPLQYLTFGTGTINGVSGSYTALLSNRNNLVQMDSTSAGIQIWNARSGTTVQTAINMYGQRVDFLPSGQSGLNAVTLLIDKRELSGLSEIILAGSSLYKTLDNIFHNFRALSGYSGAYYQNWR